MRTEMTLDQRNKLMDLISNLEAWWTLQGRFDILTEAGMRHLIPVLKLETTPQHAAFELVRHIEHTSDEKMQVLLNVLHERKRQENHSAEKEK